MARQENIKNDEGLLGGLSFGASKQVVTEPQKTAPTNSVVAPAEEQKKETTLSQDLAGSYKAKEKEETRSVRVNYLIKPSLAKKMNEAVASKEISSRNDLINYLLEKYFGE